MCGIHRKKLAGIVIYGSQLWAGGEITNYKLRVTRMTIRWHWKRKRFTTKFTKAGTACGEYDVGLEGNMTLPLVAAAGRKSKIL
jgi:hypothetical protein